MWINYAPRFGYEVLQTDHRKNFLLVRSDLRALLPPAASNSWCFDIPKTPPGASVQPWANTYRSIDKACNESHTPYTIEHEGVCCPPLIDGQPSGLSYAWCRCDVIKYPERGDGGGVKRYG